MKFDTIVSFFPCIMKIIVAGYVRNTLGKIMKELALYMKSRERYQGYLPHIYLLAEGF